jgi:hypothetical protein
MMDADYQELLQASLQAKTLKEDRVVAVALGEAFLNSQFHEMVAHCFSVSVMACLQCRSPHHQEQVQRQEQEQGQQEQRPEQGVKLVDAELISMFVSELIDPLNGLRCSTTDGEQ